MRSLLPLLLLPLLTLASPPPPPPLTFHDATSAPPPLILQDATSALFIRSDDLAIIDLVDTRRSLHAFVAPQQAWWFADFVAQGSNGAWRHRPSPSCFPPLASPPPPPITCRGPRLSSGIGKV